MNGPSTGGFDLVIVTELPPSFVTVKLAVADAPTPTLP